MVFDASAKHDGVSLPDFAVDIVANLLRFRRYSIPLCADIKQMFLQVGVAAEDRSFLRYLWRPLGGCGPPDTFEMNVHIFGAVCSPAVCIATMRKTAEDHRSQFPDVADIVSKNFYVDNYLDSVETEEEAIGRSRRLVSLWKCGGFKLTKWLSSSRNVLLSFNPSELADPTLDLWLDPLPEERTLGVMWQSDSDVFTFRTNLCIAVETKREALRNTASIFDPLGFLDPVVITAKIFLQTVWRSGLDWDEVLPRRLQQEWEAWASEMPSLTNLRIPRCLQPRSGFPLTFHVFCDAPEKAYGAVVYIRQRAKGETNVSMVISKALVVSIKTLSTPRLELQAAVVGTRLARCVADELSLVSSQFIFWTDSQKVLKWLCSERCRYHTFVANRIAEIHDSTQPTQWRHVAGTENPADDLSRGVDAASLTSDHRWFRGPAFLLEPRTSWPPPWIPMNPDENDPEVSKTLPERVLTIITPEPDQPDQKCSPDASCEMVIDLSNSRLDDTCRWNHAKAATCFIPTTERY